MKNKQKFAGFTLIELLVVIVIIGILATISISTFNGYKEKANIAKGQVFADNIRSKYAISLLASYSFNGYDINDTPATIKSLSGSNINLTTFGSPTIIEGLNMKVLKFNGSTQGVRTETISNIKAISMWIKINSIQSSGWNYLVDARSGLNGYFTDRTSVGWKSLYVNGEKKLVTWNSIPKDVWVHVYLVSNEKFTDDINIMSRYTNLETLAGYLGNIQFYSESDY